MKTKAWKRIANTKIKASHVIVGIIICLTIWLVVNTVFENSRTQTFARFYEPCEPDVTLNFTDYTLPLDANDIVNVAEMGEVIDVNAAMDLICLNGFAVMDDNFGLYAPDFVEIYKELKYCRNPKPVFITTDTGLYMYRGVFEGTLQDIEGQLFEWMMKDLIKALQDDALKKYERLDGELKEAARRNVAYLSVALSLMDFQAAVPDLVKNEVNGELTKIDAHRGVTESDIFKYLEDYSQYVPRGHYTPSEELKRYFKTMMWFGNMTFLLKGEPEGLISENDAKIQTMQACMLASSLKNTKVGDKKGLEVWDLIYTVTGFFAGFADDLTPKDYLWAIDKVYGGSFKLNDLTDERKLRALREKLVSLASPEIYSGTGNIQVPVITDESLDNVLNKTKGMRFMGRRLIPDSYIFQHLTFPEVGRYTGDPNIPPFTAGSDGNGGLIRAYIRGLDLMAVLGSSEAKKILTEDGDTYFENYQKRFNELAAEFDSYTSKDWGQNLYWSWLYCLESLLRELPEGYPNFMRTQAWHRSRLNAMLASWTQLRHDTILYGKQPYTAPPFGVRVPPGYVEPNPVFWGRLLSMTSMTRKGLEDFNKKWPYMFGINMLDRFYGMEKFLQELINITKKQLANEPLSKEEKNFFLNVPSRIGGLSSSGVPLKATLVADVHTYTFEETVIEEGVGYVDVIVVACPLADGKAFLAAGPVFSYYEFKHPMENRLTDEAWGKIFEFWFPADTGISYEQWLQELKARKKPDRPKWYTPLMVQKKD